MYPEEEQNIEEYEPIQDIPDDSPPPRANRLLEKTVVSLFAFALTWGLFQIPLSPVTAIKHFFTVSLTVDYTGRLADLGPVVPVGAKGTDVQSVLARLRVWEGPRRGELVWPADGTVIGMYGWRDNSDENRFSHGIHIQLEPDMPVKAAAGGTVRRIDPIAGGAYSVIIDHPGRWQSRYAPLRSLYVGAGNRLGAGQIIGQAPAAKTVVLYFELQVRGSSVDPLKYLPERT